MVIAEAPALTVDTVDITDSDRYRDYGYPWAEWDLLRRDAPVYWYQRPGFEPFWAITKHADIRYISSHPELFSNTQMLRLNKASKLASAQRQREAGTNRTGGHPDDPPDFIYMDPPEHRQHRSLVARHFTPRMMKMLEDHFAQMAENYVSDFADKVVADFAERGSTSAVDVVHELSAKLPVAAICSMGGVPEEDWDQIFEWTEVLVGAEDPEYRLPGETPSQASQRISVEWFHYNNNLIEERKRNLGDDLLSDLLRAEVDGRKLTPGRDSRLLRAAARRRQRDDAELDFGRGEGADRSSGADADAGRRCVAGAVGGGGDSALDVDRDPVPADGGRGCGVARSDDSQGRVGGVVVSVGESRRGCVRGSVPVRHHAGGQRSLRVRRLREHFCLGANLARWEMRSIFHALRPILPQLELTAEPEHVIGFLHVGGIKRQMVRYRPG